jgi:hypothetical protein
MSDKTAPPEDPNADHDGWQRFERAVDAALHSPPKHKAKAKRESSPAKRSKVT